MVVKIRYDLSSRGYNAKCKCSEVNGKTRGFTQVFACRSSAEAVDAVMGGELGDLAI